MGVLKATLILGEVVFRMGFDVKKAEVHGMSQRGGSVSSDVRFGDKGEDVLSPMIPAGEVDYLLSLEPEWSDAHLADLRPGGVVISANDFDIAKLANPKALNVAALGALSTHCDFPPEVWSGVLHDSFPEKLWATNEAAFAYGRDATAG